MLCALPEAPPMLKITGALKNEVFPNKDINTKSSTVNSAWWSSKKRKLLHKRSHALSQV